MRTGRKCQVCGSRNIKASTLFRFLSKPETLIGQIPKKGDAEFVQLEGLFCQDCGERYRHGILGRRPKPATE